MGTGWRRAFCTTIPRDDNNNNRESSAAAAAAIDDKHQQQQITLKSLPKLGGLFSSGGRSSSNPSTPRLRCRTSAQPPAAANDGDSLLVSPKLRSKTTPDTPKSSTTAKTPKPLLSSNPSSPRSPFSIFKNTLRLSRNSCGVCLQSMKTGQKMAIFTGECLHSFHFPCIAAHVRKHSSLVCPVCSTTWKDVPLLAIHKIQQNHPQHEEEKREKLIRPKIYQKEEIIIKHQKPQKNIKHLTYNDDEPLLLSPTSSGGCIPIPEENETEEIEDEVDEFKGFFVNPISSSSNNYESITNSKGVEVKLLPEVAIVSVGRTHEAYAVLCCCCMGRAKVRVLF